MKIISAVLEIIFPTRCVSCGRRQPLLLCGICEAKLSPLENFYCASCAKPASGGFTHALCLTRFTAERVLSGFIYKGTAQSVVKALKYKGIRRVAEVMADLLADDLADKGITFGKEAAVVPVPLAFWRKGARGFNQSELLARALASRLGLDFRGDLLKKVKETASQVPLSKKERGKNIKGVFKAIGKLDKKDILLVDDVLTTGATAREAAKALKKGGAGQVWVLTFAKD